MKRIISFTSKIIKKNVLLLLISIVSVAQAQQNDGLSHVKATKNPIYARTASTATCPASPVILQGYHATGNPFNTNHNFNCDLLPFTISTAAGDTIAEPCILTTYTNFDPSLGTNSSLHIFEGGLPYDSLCPNCLNQVGNVNGGGSITGAPFGLIEYELYPNKKHDFTFCTSGSITTTTISMQDCWTGAPIAYTPQADSILSNVTANPCYSISIPANTDIGSAAYSIAPASATVALTDLSNGAAHVDPSLLPPGTYTVTYHFTPSVSSGCGTVTGTFVFTTTAAPTLTVTSNPGSLCAGNTATLTANGATTYTWSPSTGLSSSTGATVTTTPSVTTTYTVTAKKGTCTVLDTLRVTVSPIMFTVNTVSVCLGDTATLIASNSSFSYTWSPATGLNTTTKDTVKASPSTTTIYTITATNGSGCVSKPVFDTLTVKINPTITVLSPTVCVGTTATITATGATSYTWTPTTNLTQSATRDTVYSANPLVPISYTVTGTAANGCISSAVSQVVTSNHLGILSGTPLNRCFGSFIQLSAIGGSTYTWTPNHPADLSFVNNTGYTVVVNLANVGTDSIFIYAESNSGPSLCTGRDTVVLTINPTPTITTVGNASPSICAGSPVVLQTASSGTVPVTYAWSPATALSSTTTSSVTASPTVTTIYTAVGSYTSGCASAAAFTVNVIPVPSFTVNSAVFCSGLSDSLKVVPTTTATAASSYTWSPATGLSATSGSAVLANPTASGAAAVIQTYTVTGSNSANGTTCPNISSVIATVTVNPLPQISVPASPICGGQTTALGATGAATYTWTSSSTPPTITTGSTVVVTPSVTITYTIAGTSSVSAGSCTNYTTATIVVNDAPGFSASVIPNTFCLGDSSIINLTPNNPALSATYAWGPAGGLSATTGTHVVATPTVAGTNNYLVTATATSTCQFQQVISLNVKPLPSITVNSPTACIGLQASTSATATLIAGGGSTYTWTPASSLSAATGATVFANPLAAPGSTSYTLTGTDNTTGCVNHTITTVQTNPTPATNITIAPATATVCEGKTVTLSCNTVPGAASYEWTGPDGFSVTAPGTATPASFTATVADNASPYFLQIVLNGCYGYASQTLSVTATPTISVQPVAPLCSGTSTELEVSSSSSTASYTWSPAITLSSAHSATVTASPSVTTIYTVKASDNGCPSASSQTVSVTVNTLNALISYPADPARGDIPFTVSFANGSTSPAGTIYTWNYGNGTSLVTTTSVSDSGHTVYPNIGTYQVILTANAAAGSACTVAYDTLTVIVTETYSLTIPNVFTPNADGVNDGFFVSGKGVQSFDILIYDRWGLKMFESSTLGFGGAWDGKNADDGTYFYIIKATSTKGVSQDYKGYLTLIK
jgi:gliding motility-associated-like protein